MAVAVAVMVGEVDSVGEAIWAMMVMMVMYAKSNRMIAYPHTYP